MTAPLEMRYRRLLAVYPAEHRRAYEEEMVGVLMAGAEPGQRRPALADAADLLWSGLVARLGRGAQGLRRSAWRDAAAVAGLISVVLLAAVACRRLVVGLTYFLRYDDPMRFLGLDGGLLLDAAARSVAWVAVIGALLLAARRTAIALTVVALLVELAAIAVWLPGQEFRVIQMSWAPALALLTLALLVLSRRRRPATTVLDRRGRALIAVGLALAAAGTVLMQFWTLPMQIFGLFRVTEGLLLIAGAFLLAGLWRIAGPVRRRTLVLLAPVLAVPVAQRLVEQVIGIELARSVTPGMVLTDLLLIITVPLLAFATAAAALHVRENYTVSLRVEGREETIG
jgi:hypothetical protein